MFEKERNCSKHNFIAVLVLSIVIKINVLQQFKNIIHVYVYKAYLQSFPTLKAATRGPCSVLQIWINTQWTDYQN